MADRCSADTHRPPLGHRGEAAAGAGTAGRTYWAGHAGQADFLLAVGAGEGETGCSQGAKEALPQLEDMSLSVEFATRADADRLRRSMDPSSVWRP